MEILFRHLSFDCRRSFHGPLVKSFLGIQHSRWAVKHDRIALMTKPHELAGHIAPLGQSIAAQKLLCFLVSDLAILFHTLSQLSLLELINANLLLLILCQRGLACLGPGAPLGQRTLRLPFWRCLGLVLTVERRCIFLERLYVKMFVREFEP